MPSGCGSRVPKGGIDDLDESKLAGALRQQLACKLKDAVTGGEEAPIVAPRADPRRAGWSRNPAKRSDAPAWPRVHGRRLGWAS